MAWDESGIAVYLQTQGKKALPVWNELPDIDLYMDQVTSLVNRYLENKTKERMLTPSMVNNYVKMKLMPAPVKKKYGREHLMYLIVICVLKQVMPLSSVEKLLQEGLTETAPDVFYENFRALYQAAFQDAANDAGRMCKEGSASKGVTLALAMKAQAEQTLAQGLLEQTN